MLLALALVLGCASDPTPAAPDAALDAAPDADPCRGVSVGGPCTCATKSGHYPGTQYCSNGSPFCACPLPDATTTPMDAVDATADAREEPAVDAATPVDTAPDVAPAPDAAAPADVAVDTASDAPIVRRSCAEGVPPTCVDHAPCAVCLPSAGGLAWCCSAGYCRPTRDRSSCE